MNVIGIAGKMGAGKDTTADILVAKHDFVRVALADEMKRFCRSVYSFTDEQLWGASEERNKPDKRYPRKKHEFVAQAGYDCLCCGAPYEDEMQPSKQSQCYLTPRYALRLLGSEWGRHLWEDTWVRKTMEIADELRSLQGTFAEYTPQEGVVTGGRNVLRRLTLEGVVISDVRFDNEARAIREAGGRIWLKTSGERNPIVAHVSEAGISRDLIDETLPYVFAEPHFVASRLEHICDLLLKGETPR